MDKAQTLHTFWSGFGIPAYDENSVPDDAVMPYITYTVATDSIDNPVPLTASIWYDSTAWDTISQKAEKVAESVGKRGHLSLPFDDGYLYLTKGTPFIQRMPDVSDTVKRIYINIMVEFLSAY